MPELRQNFFTKEWVIIATERAKRPEELASRQAPRRPAEFVENCPFCPGNESKTPPEIFRIPPEGNGSWQVRVIPNKFAALSRELQPVRTIQRSRRSLAGFGVHDVIVETTNHAHTTALMPETYVANVLRAYKARYDALSLDSRIAQITIFKNHGADAGTSLEHPHSQLVASPVISHQVRERLEEALRHYDEYGECMFCQMIEEELGEQSRIVIRSDHFVAMEPFASPTPFATYIFPRRHMAGFSDIGGNEISDLARVLRTVMAKLYHGLHDPDFNYTIRSAPIEALGVKYFHWYVSVIPRLTRVAGFELGSGMFINTVLPEAAAEFLRGVTIEQAASAG